MTELKTRLLQEIRTGGPLPFEEFQAAALYDPEGGFFASETLRSVKSGDFLTSPEVSPLFGETLARFVDRELATISADSADRLPLDGGGAVPAEPAARRGWRDPSPDSEGGRRTADGDVPLFVEVGAGSGSLLQHLLAALETPVEPWAVEASPAARAALGDLLPAERVVSTLDDLPQSFSGVILANELLDNLPVALAVRTGEAWTERWVGEQDGDLVLVPVESRPEVAEWAERFGLPCPEGGVVEVQLEAGEWLRAALARLRGGVVVVIDYGELAENLEHRRAEGTLRTYRAHHLGPHPLDEPGETDITADVNFSALLAVAEAAEATVEYHRQDDFLAALGLRERLRDLRHEELALAREGEPLERLQVRSQRTEAETLLHPRGLGDFRVMVVRVGTNPGA